MLFDAKFIRLHLAVIFLSQVCILKGRFQPQGGYGQFSQPSPDQGFQPAYSVDQVGQGFPQLEQEVFFQPDSQSYGEFGPSDADFLSFTGDGTNQSPQMGQPGQAEGNFLQNQPQQSNFRNMSSGNMLSGNMPSLKDMMKFINSKYDELFPSSDWTPGPIDPSTLFPLPDLSDLGKKVPKNGIFYSFSPVHREALSEVRHIFERANSTIQFLDIAKALKYNSGVQPHLWFYAMSNSALENPELGSIHKVSPVEALPDLFISADVLERARREQSTRERRQAGRQSCAVIDETTGADNGIENRLWYFRESIAVNSHHWYYHTMYPFSARSKPDRNGELFYYMHSSIVARYNAERLSNGLGRVQPFSEIQRGMLLEGYNGHLQDDASGRIWTPRRANLSFTDIMHQDDPSIRTNIFIRSHILQARARVLQAINSGFVIDTRNQRISINNRQGIDILGDLLQSSEWSINSNYYGSGSTSGFHNNGHLLFAYQSDPLYRLRLSPGVMADSATAMRDVLFYRWHATMNLLLEAHKSELQPYAPSGGELPLSWPGVEITSLSAISASGNTNQIQTFWRQQPLTLNRGLDLGQRQSRRALRVCAKHLDHEPFSYQITINKDNSVRTSRATIRIFLAPRFDEAGNRFDMMTQRKMFFILDSFGVTLNAGSNSFTRRSIDSRLTIPWAQSLRELNSDTGTPFCGCGWPRHMLLPKGTPGGMVFDLFMMVTNGDEDAVQQSWRGEQACIAAPLYCGISNQRYPDSKPMGYPFDRLPYSTNQGIVSNLDEYVNGIMNMATTQIEIRFTEQTMK